MAKEPHQFYLVACRYFRFTLITMLLQLLVKNAPCAMVIFDNSTGHYCNPVEVVGM